MGYTQGAGALQHPVRLLTKGMGYTQGAGALQHPVRLLTKGIALYGDDPGELGPVEAAELESNDKDDSESEDEALWSEDEELGSKDEELGSEDDGLDIGGGTKEVSGLRQYVFPVAGMKTSDDIFRGGGIGSLSRAAGRRSTRK